MNKYLIKVIFLLIYSLKYFFKDIRSVDIIYLVIFVLCIFNISNFFFRNVCFIIMYVFLFNFFLGNFEEVS